MKVRELSDEKSEEQEWHQRDQEQLRLERINHQHALQALEKHACEELQAERQHLHTQYKLQLGKYNINAIFTYFKISNLLLEFELNI